MKILRHICILLVFTGFNSCKSDWSPSEGYLISGEITGLDEGKIILAKIDLQSNEKVIVDSTFVKAGKFSFKGKLESPYLHTIFVNDSLLKIHLFLDNSKILIRASAKDPEDILVSGSREDSLFRSYELDSIFEKKTGMEIMLNYPDHVFSAFVAYYQFQIHPPGSTQMDQIINNYSASVQNSEYYKHLFSLYSVLKRVAISRPAPDFALPDVNGDTVHLNSFRGKYVLLDFWASWCPPCRAVNPDLVRIHRQYVNKGFTIVGISVDKNKNSWLRAIEKDQLLWTNLSALDGWGSITQLYGVKAVPQNFLIDPRGIILDKNLEAEELQERLQDLLSAPTG